MSGQSSLTQYDKRAEDFAKVRALIMKIVNSRPGLTVAEISEEFLLRFHFLPRIDNRLRELRLVGWVESRMENDLLRWYPKDVGVCGEQTK